MCKVKAKVRLKVNLNDIFKSFTHTFSFLNSCDTVLNTASCHPQSKLLRFTFDIHNFDLNVGNLCLNSIKKVFRDLVFVVIEIILRLLEIQPQKCVLSSS